ncbi:hypothetical protein ACOJR9_06170 [Alteromonas sp. A081]|uniref:hypothetical protein n=1 Tax=Alteromonas sp. A081 TaxID=3410269 RepID=UPI003B9812DE
MRVSCFFIAVFFLAGCESLIDAKEKVPEALETHTKTALDSTFCLYEKPPENFLYNCDVNHWIGLWVNASAQPWSQRKQTLDALTNSDYDRLHAYILTLMDDTPYQDRLRAQLAFNELSPRLIPQSRKIIDVIAGAQNNQLMQFESALVVLEKENTSRGEKLITLQSEIDSLRKKLEELLQIEATLMDKNRSTQQ